MKILVVGGGGGNDVALQIFRAHLQAGQRLFLAVEAAVVVGVLENGAAYGSAARNADQRTGLAAAFNGERLKAVLAAGVSLLETVDRGGIALKGQAEDGAVLGQAVPVDRRCFFSMMGVKRFSSSSV